MDAPGTGELSNQSIMRTESKPQPSLEQGRISGEAARCPTPEDSPTESSNTLATETVVVSSPEPTYGPACDEELSAADFPTLQGMQREASANVATLTTQLTTARAYLSRINKRLKTMQSGQETDTPSASPSGDVEMERMD